MARGMMRMCKFGDPGGKWPNESSQIALQWDVELWVSTCAQKSWVAVLRESGQLGGEMARVSWWWKVKSEMDVDAPMPYDQGEPTGRQ